MMQFNLQQLKLIQNGLKEMKLNHYNNIYYN